MVVAIKTSVLVPMAMCIMMINAQQTIAELHQYGKFAGTIPSERKLCKVTSFILYITH